MRHRRWPGVVLVLAACHHGPSTDEAAQVASRTAATPGPEQKLAAEPPPPTPPTPPTPRPTPPTPPTPGPSHDVRIELSATRLFSYAEGYVRTFPRLELNVTLEQRERTAEQDNLMFSIKLDAPFQIGGTLHGALDHVRLAGHDCEASGDISTPVPAALDVRRPVRTQLLLRATIGACEGLLGWHHPLAIDATLPLDLYELPAGNL